MLKPRRAKVVRWYDAVDCVVFINGKEFATIGNCKVSYTEKW